MIQVIIRIAIQLAHFWVQIIVLTLHEESIINLFLERMGLLR